MRNYSEEEKYWIWLSHVPEMTPKAFYSILKEFGCAGDFFDAVRNASPMPGLPGKLAAGASAACSAGRVSEIIAHMNMKGIGAVTRLSPDYPETLAAIPYPPPVLYYKGEITGLFGSGPELRCVSIVGTRRCTHRGYELTRRIAEELAGNGITAVSGMARGIDTAAHAGALGAGGKTVAVLGCGADVIYPAENEELYHRITENGAVISELPAGTQPLSENFPVRNRIIAGLSKAVLVVESEEEGGTAITASMAISYGHDVFAVPGAPYLRTSALSNMLVARGAVPVNGAEDILGYYGRPSDKKAANGDIKHIQLDFLQRQIYNLLLRGDAGIESIASSIEYPQNEINSALTMMELCGMVKRLPGGRYGL